MQKDLTSLFKGFNLVGLCSFPRYQLGIPWGKILIFVFLFLLIGCGDGNDDKKPIPDTTPIDIPDPEPQPLPITDCCPTEENYLKCEQCTIENPCLTEADGMIVYCTGDLYQKPWWYLQIGWGILRIDIETSLEDLVCCPVGKTGICYQDCNELNKCDALYGVNPTEWKLFGDEEGRWYVFDSLKYKLYQIFNKE